MERRNDPPFFEEVAPPPSMPLFFHPGLGHRSHPHHHSLALSPFGGMGMGLMPFAGPSPFSMMNGMMRNMDGMMRNMQRQADNGQSFSSSSTTVMHYSSDGSGESPRVYHASSSTRQGPGGVKETRKAVRDSHTGVQKMAVGHHIGERSHMIERRVNAKTGERAENEEFINLDDTDAETFGEEWREKTHSLNHTSSSILPNIERNRFSDRRGLPSTSRPPNPVGSYGVEDDGPSGGGVEGRRRRGGKRKKRPVSLSGEEAGSDTHTATASRRPSKLIRTRSPPYVVTSQPQSHSHSSHHTPTGLPPVHSHADPAAPSARAPKKA